MAKRAPLSLLALSGFLVMAIGTNKADLMEAVSGEEGGGDEAALVEPPPPPPVVEEVPTAPAETTSDSPPPIEANDAGEGTQDPVPNRADVDRCCCVESGQSFGALKVSERCADTCYENYTSRRPVMGGRCRPKEQQ